jgi:ABC-2 type transport system permease protein
MWGRLGVSGTFSIQSVLERVRVNLGHVATFYYEEVSNIAVWWLWNIPFQFLQIFFSLLLFRYFAAAFGGSSPLYGGNFMAYIISGLMINTYMDASLEVYYHSMAALYHGRMGVGGVHLSRRDFLHLAGISPYVFIFARVSWRYLMETLTFALYLLTGVLFFGFRVSAGVDWGLVFLIVLLSVAACSGIGLVSASMYFLAGAYRGVEPIAWFVRLFVPLAAGIYVPRELLPKELVVIGDILPQTYAASAIRRVLLGGAMLNGVAAELRVLVLQAAVLIPIGIVLLRYSLSLERRRATMF